MRYGEPGGGLLLPCHHVADTGEVRMKLSVNATIEPCRSYGASLPNSRRLREPRVK